MPAPDPALWPTVRRILDLLDETSDAEREATLLQGCTDSDGVLDEALLAEVRALLLADALSESDGFLEDAAAEHAAHLLAETIPDGLGERVGPWQVTGLLGEGGMGVVYRARRADGAYEQEAALKVIGRGLAPPSLIERFRRERQILAGLTHPNVARLLDGGVSDVGQPYFAMELVEGEPITTYCDARGLEADDRVRLFGQVVAAVTHAHGRLVVHRDLKPSNVLVADLKDGPRVKLLDFGIAKLLDDDNARTRTAHLLTPEYAAPEQVAGGEITTATDVYALGVLLYELLAGSRPHALEDASPTEWGRALATPPPAPSVRARAPLGDLDAVVLKALCPEPEHRYASADAFGDDLERYLEGLPVQARPPTVRYRVRSFVRRHPVGVAAAAAFAALLIGFSAVSATQAQRLEVERDRATTEAEKALEMQEYLVGLFSAVDPNQAQGRELTVRELLAEGTARIETDLAGRPLVQAEVYRQVGSVYSRIGYHAEALAARSRSLDLLSAVHGDAHPDVVRMQTAVGETLFDLGDAEAADSILQAGLALVPLAFDGPDARVANLYRVVAMLRNSLGDYAEADSLFRLSIATHGASADPDSTLWSLALAGLGLSLFNRGEYGRADSLFRRRLAFSRAQYGERHTDVAYAHHYLGLVARSDGRLEDAARSYDRALDIRRLLLGEDHPDTAQTLQNLAVVVKNLGRYTEAEALYRETLETMRVGLGPSHYQVAIVRNNLASVLVADERPREALPHAERALQDIEAHFGPDHAMSSLIRGTRAKVLLGLGRLEDAKADYRLALEVHRAVMGEAHPKQAPLLLGLGRVLHAQDDLRGAEASLRDALSLLEAEHSPGDVRTAEARLYLGLVLADRGEREMAQRLFEDAAPTITASFADPSISIRKDVERLRARLG